MPETTIRHNIANVPETISKLPISPDTRLAVDCGGSTLRIVECKLDGEIVESQKYPFPGDRFVDLTQGLATFLREVGHRPAAGVIGAAGPVRDKTKVKLTNIVDWPPFDAVETAETFQMRLKIYNDLVVAGAAIPVLQDKDVDIIRAGTERPKSPRLIATISTGFNDAVVLPSARGGEFKYLPGEAGHSPFSPRDEVEAELLRWAWKQHDGYVSFEDVASAGRGFALLLEFVDKVLDIPAPQSILATVETGRPAGPEITTGAINNNDPACSKALELHGAILGNYLGSRTVATCAGSVHLVGSVALDEPLMRHYLQHTKFIERFEEQGRQSTLTSDVPITRITHSYPGLVGAIELARNIP